MAKLYCATLTPIGDDGAIDHARLRMHASRLVDDGCDGIALFGTTGEGASFTTDEKLAALDALVEQGIASQRLIFGAIAPALPDLVALARGAVARGCTNVMVLPPFYAKDVTDDGLFRVYADLIAAVGDDRLSIILYHIPQVSGIALGTRLIERLAAAFPGQIAGVKDSSCDRRHALQLIERFGDLDIYVGFEPDLPATVAAGGAGTICGLANLVPQCIRNLLDRDAGSDEQVVLSMIEALKGVPFIPTSKAALAAKLSDARWNRCRPPYLAATREQAAALVGTMAPSVPVPEDECRRRNRPRP